MMLQTSPKPSASGSRDKPSVAVLGAGFSGMAMAIALKKAGFGDFTIYEKADDFGGTWRENTYPGVACDVPSHLYSLSYEPNPRWTKRYSPGQEIWDYMRGVAKRRDLYSHARFGKKVTGIRHDGRKWRVDFADASQAAADVVISALGGLHEPNVPEFEGASNFKGPIFHTAQWRHDIDLKGKRVAVVGSAASAVQVIPAIAEKVAHLDVYQRTANWIMPRMSYGYPAWARGLFERVPPLARLYRGWYFSMLEGRHRAFRKEDNWTKRFVRRVFEKHLSAQVADTELKRKLTPKYPVGCKRILVADDYFPAIQRENVDLVIAAIDRFEEKGVRTKDGKLREADVIILATGFKPFNLLDSIEVAGPAGATLRETWSHGVTAHRTVAVPGFPNFFLLLGPNSGLGHNSVILMIEAQVNYVMQLMERISEGATIEPSPDAARAYDERLQRELSDRVWAANCGAWYVDERGRNFTLYPNTVREYLKEMREPVAAEYIVKQAVTA
jgi:cation diffusion facilitator CzcD-associated flavoprotein CzcO